MVLIFSCFLLFFLVGFLIVVFHSYLWDFNWQLFNNLRAWCSPFECGFLSQRVSENYFSCSYFLLLVFFVIFDLEVSLLLNMPCQGVLFKNAGFYAFFIFFLLVGYCYEVERGYVVWSR